MQGAVSVSSHTAIMQRQHQKPTNLTINSKSAAEAAQTSTGPNSSPIHLEGVDLSSFGGDFGGSTLTSLPPLPSSPPTSPGHRRGASKNILNSFKSRSHEQAKGGIRQVKDEGDANRPGSSSMAKIYQLKKNPGSTPELSLLGSADKVDKMSQEAHDTATPEARPQPSPHHSDTSVTSRRTAKPTGPFRNPLARTKSLRRDSHSKTKPDPRPTFEQPPNTAPIAPEWSRQQDMRLLGPKGKDKRGKSAERAAVSESDDNEKGVKSHDKEKGKEKSGFMSGSKNAVSKTTKASGNFLTRLGKIGRSSSNNEKEVPDSEYVFKNINLPLVEQTRITRISKDLGNCRDKTEFWMPSLPWRCIDYLNLNCESEGLYRIPGSGPQVKKWQRRFDTELDVDLLDESDLYDPNNIGSMLKSWLRDLPTEIMPASLQAALADELEKENPDYARMGQPAPQKLRDALSELSPFNYYLLFAITCHLSLLLSHKDKNRMDLNNLCICIGPCLRLERWLFNYLVGDWRHCWQGCYTEKQYLESEKMHEQGEKYEPPTEVGLTKLPNGSSHNLLANERVVHSSGSSEPASHYEDARPTLAESTVQRKKENEQPETYRPAGARQFSSSSFSTPQRSPTGQVEVKRPATADARKTSDEALQKGTPKHHTHGRSKSDVPTTPISTEFSVPPLPSRQ